MAAQADERVMISERIAPGMLPRVLNSFDMTIIFVAIVLFIVNASAIQQAHQAAYTYWILGFLAFLIPGALVTAQLGQMIPQEGSLYVWTQKALGPFWGFFAGFCAWWPGVLVMVATGDLVMTMLQFLGTTQNQNWLSESWQQGLVILAVIWFSTVLSIMRFRVTQNMVNTVFVVYGAAIAAVALAGITWLISGHKAANSFAASSFALTGGNATFYGLVILALLGIEVPLNMGVEIRERRAITSYLFWGSIVVMAAYLLLTFGAMVLVPQNQANSTYAILQAVQMALGTPIAWIVTLILIAFFMFNTTVYNYSFARLLFVSGLDRRLPAFVGRVNANKVPQNAVLVQAVLTTIVTAITFFLFGLAGNINLGTQIYIVLQAAVTVIWCLSMVMLFADVLIIRSKYPEEFRREQLAPVGVFVLASVVGAIASAVGIWVTLTGSWNVALIGNRDWLLIVGGVAVVSLVVAVVVYLMGLNQARRALATAGKA